jgi:predicted Zn-dependent protease
MRYLPFGTFLALFGCSAADGPNVFSIQDDIDLGAQLEAEIQADPETYPVLDADEYRDAYAHVEGIRDDILASGDLDHADDFEWKLAIIDDDETLNAFAAPGGYIWVYTGILRFLDSDDQLAGVLGHEMAHADQRHATQQLTRQYGIELLIAALLGRDPGVVAQVAEGLVQLKFSRTQEAEADEYSVIYLCDTQYAANGAAGFFEKMEGQSEPPEFLSDHPSSDSRIEEINAKAEELGCSVVASPDGDYQDLVDSLPRHLGGSIGGN